MPTLQKIRRYNMNDIPPGASPTRRAIGPNWSGITQPQGGTTAVGLPQTAGGPTAVSPQLPGASFPDLIGYTQGEFRKIKQTLDSFEAQFVTDEMSVVNLNGQIFRFWTFATGSDVSVTGGPSNVGYPANQTITKLRGDTSLFVALQMGFTPTAASNTNDLLVNIDGTTIAQGRITATLNITSVVDLFAIADLHFNPAVLTVGNHTVNVQLGTSASATTFILSGANLWIWEQLMPSVIFQ